MIIEVTQADIDQGKPRSFTGCPIAIALKRTGAQNVVVSSRSIGIRLGLNVIMLDAPESVYDFVKSFDAQSWLFRWFQGKPVPFSFELPDEFFPQQGPRITEWKTVQEFTAWPASVRKSVTRQSVIGGNR